MTYLVDPYYIDELGNKVTLGNNPFVSTTNKLLEADPTGRNQHETGAKLDQGKNRLALVLGGFSTALQAVGDVGTYGANKYTDNGWKDVPNGVQRYSDAMLRHFFAEQAGEMYDPETKLLHAAATAWNALARLQLIIKEQSGE